VYLITETPRFRDWVQQFDAADRDTARALVDALTLVSAEEFEHGLMETVEKWVAELAPSGLTPVALYPVQEFPSGFCSLFDGSGKPLPLCGQPGSEGRTASIATRIHDVESTTFLNRPSIEEMREKRCRTVLFLDDLVGSGDRAADFVRRFRVHPTIKSWLSLGYITLGIATYAINETAEQPVSKELGGEDNLRFWRRPMYGPTLGAPGTRARTEHLCRTYARRANLYSQGGALDPLGYRNANTGMVFEHGCPNNAPLVLRHWRGAWQPLFGPARTGPKDLSPCFRADAIPSRTQDQLLLLGQRRLAEGDWRRLTSAESWNRLLVLAAIHQRMHSAVVGPPGLSYLDAVRRLHRLAGVPIPHCQTAVDWLIDNGLLTDSWRITETGRAVLAYARRRRFLVEKEMPLREDYYFPHVLR